MQLHIIIWPRRLLLRTLYFQNMPPTMNCQTNTHEKLGRWTSKASQLVSRLLSIHWACVFRPAELYFLTLKRHLRLHHQSTIVSHPPLTISFSSRTSISANFFISFSVSPCSSPKISDCNFTVCSSSSLASLYLSWFIIMLARALVVENVNSSFASDVLSLNTRIFRSNSAALSYFPWPFNVSPNIAILLNLVECSLPWPSSYTLNACLMISYAIWYSLTI